MAPDSASVTSGWSGFFLSTRRMPVFQPAILAGRSFDKEQVGPVGFFVKNPWPQFDRRVFPEELRFKRPEIRCCFRSYPDGEREVHPARRESRKQARAGDSPHRNPGCSQRNGFAVGRHAAEARKNADEHGHGQSHRKYGEEGCDDDSPYFRCCRWIRRTDNFKESANPLGEDDERQRDKREESPASGFPGRCICRVAAFGEIQPVSSRTCFATSIEVDLFQFCKVFARDPMHSLNKARLP